jgi:hypothetical protein
MRPDEKRDHVEDLDMHGRMILKWNEVIWLRIGTSGGCL